MAGFVFVLRVSAAFVAKAFESYAAHVGAALAAKGPAQATNPTQSLKPWTIQKAPVFEPC